MKRAVGGALAVAVVGAAVAVIALEVAPAPDLAREFDAHVGEVRVLALLSPT